MYNKDHVNRRNTRTWVRLNEDSRSHLYRNEFIAQHGGEFTRQGRHWHWNEKVAERESKPTRSTYLFTRPSGRKVVVENFSKYCKKNELSVGTMYQVVRGERKTHKGFTARKLS